MSYMCAPKAAAPSIHETAPITPNQNFGSPAELPATTTLVERMTTATKVTPQKTTELPAVSTMSMTSSTSVTAGSTMQQASTTPSVMMLHFTPPPVTKPLGQNMPASIVEPPFIQSQTPEMELTTPLPVELAIEPQVANLTPVQGEAIPALASQQRLDNYKNS